MVRNYKRKTNRGADGEGYTKDNLEEAVADVRNNNKSIRQAALVYGIPRSTLNHYIKGTRGKGVVAEAGHGGGGKQTLSVDEEKDLASAVKALEKWGFGLCRDEVLQVVKSYLDMNERTTRFKENLPGAEWFLNLKKRNRLSLKKPQAVESLRMDQTNPFVIFGFFDLLERTINELNLRGRPHLIFNCDETSFCHDPSKTKIVGAVNAKSVRMTGGSGRENTTVLVSCSASGGKIPLLCVFKGKHVMESWMDDGKVNLMAYTASQQGWMDSIIFKNWFLKVFLPNIPEERPVLLIYDGHASHCNLEVIQAARDNSVTILKLPPHTTHILQPLDVGIFKSMKVNWDKKLTEWQRQNPRRKIPKSDFVKLINAIHMNVSEGNIVKSFEATGIYDQDKKGPNRQRIDCSIFRPEDLCRYENDQKKDVQDENSVASENHGSAAPKESTSDELNKDSELLMESKLPVIDAINTTEFICSKECEISTESSEFGLHSITENLNAVASTFKATELLEENSRPVLSAGELTNFSQCSKFEEIILKFFAGPQNQKSKTEIKRKRLCKEAEIITSDEYMRKKEEEQKKKKPKIASEVKKTENSMTVEPLKKEKMTKKAIEKELEDLGDSSGGEWEQCQDDEEEIDVDAFLETVKEVKVSEWVLVEYQGKKSSLYYAGCVTALYGPEITVNFLKKRTNSMHIQTKKMKTQFLLIK